MGSLGIAAWIAMFAFPTILVWGWFSGELAPKATAIFAILGAAVWFGLPQVPNGENFRTSALAVIDVALVLAVFKRDVRIGYLRSTRKQPGRTSVSHSSVRDDRGTEQADGADGRAK